MGEAKRTRVLVVEDEFLICDMVTTVLEEHGFEVHAVATARDALAHLTGGALCDVLFTDINLRGGLDGDALAWIARDLRPDLPVVYATGSVSRLQDLDAVEGAVIMPKPYSPEKVCEMLDRLVVNPRTLITH